MRLLRYAAALLLLVYALASLSALGALAAARMHVWTPDGPLAGLADLAADASWPRLAIWAGAVALYLLVVINLVLRYKAFTFWAAAFLLDVVAWVWLHAGGRYEAVVPPALAQADSTVIGVNLLLGAAILVLGRFHLD